MAEKKTWDEQFVEFHNANPHVYEALVQSARSFREQTGKDKCGMSLLVGRARWVLAIRSNGEEEFAINSNYAPFYSRLIMDREEDLKGFFDLRSSIADLDGSWYGKCA